MSALLQLLIFSKRLLLLSFFNFSRDVKSEFVGLLALILLYILI